MTHKLNYIRGALVAAVLLLCTNAVADVNIVYPFDGGQHPTSFPTPSPIDSYYLPASFSVVCPGGPHKVNWSINGEELGVATFYDQFTTQFVYKLAAGGHFMDVETDKPRLCGLRTIKFQVVSSS